jgi:hypothetical protein
MTAKSATATPADIENAKAWAEIIGDLLDFAPQEKR